MKRRQALAALAAGTAAGTAWPQAQKQSQTPKAKPKPKPKPQPPPTTAEFAAAAELGADIDLATEILATLHPGLLRYNSQLQIDAGMTSLKRAFAAPGDLTQRYLVLSRFLAMVRCSRSHANVFNQKPEIAQALFDRRSRLPFSMRWIGEGMFVTSQDERLPPGLTRGTQVGAVNGVPVRTMLQALLPYARADGSNDAARRRLLDVRGTAQLEAFDVFHGLVYGEPPGGVFTLDVRTPDGTISKLDVPALTMAERHAQVPAPAPEEPRWTWRIDEANAAAVLSMPSWAVPVAAAGGWDWQAWLAEKLDIVAGDAALRGLVVDLRGNDGGLDCGNPILERFLTADSVLAQRRLVRYQRTPPHLDKHLGAWNESLRDWGTRARRHDSRFFALPAGENTLKPKGARIEKPLLVLVDAGSGGASFTFAQRLKASRAGRLVGEATGGNQRGLNGGAFFFVRLPASELEFDLPLIGSFPVQPAPDAGIEPDVKAQLGAVDVATGIDAPLERALGLLR